MRSDKEIEMLMERLMKQQMDTSRLILDLKKKMINNVSNNRDLIKFNLLESFPLYIKGNTTMLLLNLLFWLYVDKNKMNEFEKMRGHISEELYDEFMKNKRFIEIGVENIDKIAHDSFNMLYTQLKETAESIDSI